MIAWGDSPADVDLNVVDPNGARVTKTSPGCIASNGSNTAGIGL